MTIEKEPVAGDLPVAGSGIITMDGTWECLENHIINIKWPEFDGVYYLLWKEGSPTLCYDDGGARVCADKISIQVNVEVKEVIKGKVQE